MKILKETQQQTNWSSQHKHMIQCSCTMYKYSFKETAQKVYSKKRENNIK